MSSSSGNFVLPGFFYGVNQPGLYAFTCVVKFWGVLPVLFSASPGPPLGVFFGTSKDEKNEKTYDDAMETYRGFFSRLGGEDALSHSCG